MAEQMVEPAAPTSAPRKKRRAIITLIIFTALNIVLVGVLWSRLAAAQHIISGKATVPLVGHPAPDFTLTTWDGHAVHLAALKGKPVVLNFWASWCQPCQSEVPALESAWNHYQTDGVTFLGVDYQDQQQAAQQFLHTYAVTYLTGPDSSGDISVAYGVSNVPATIVINQSGAVVWEHLGPITPAMLDSQLQPLLAAQSFAGAGSEARFIKEA